jgi:hypothetical protein
VVDKITIPIYYGKYIEFVFIDKCQHQVNTKVGQPVLFFSIVYYFCFARSRVESSLNLGSSFSHYKERDEKN